MLLENQTIKLRAPEPEDLDLLYKWENNPDLWVVSNTPQPYSRYALKQYIEQCGQSIYESLQLRLMIVEKQSNTTIGTVDLFDFDIHNSRIALGLYIEASYQGKGFATEALHLTEQYIFEHLKLHQLYCHIAVNNTASCKMFEKEGYLKNGVLKNWIKSPNGFEDIIVFQKFSSGYEI